LTSYFGNFRHVAWKNLHAAAILVFCVDSVKFSIL
jgi:hypothetical protein